MTRANRWIIYLIMVILANLTIFYHDKLLALNIPWYAWLMLGMIIPLATMLGGVIYLTDREENKK